jgi:hypothetical protein
MPKRGAPREDSSSGVRRLVLVSSYEKPRLPTFHHAYIWLLAKGVRNSIFIRLRASEVRI